MTSRDPRIHRIDIWPVDVPLTDPFVISRGAARVASNLFVRIGLENQIQGYGEIAPFTALTGENRATSLEAARRLTEILLDQPVARYRYLSNVMADMEPDQPAARCGLETALLDAWTRWLGIPLWALWGGARLETRRTDVTLPILDAERTLSLADHWRQRGFSTFKLKVGSDLERETSLALSLARRHPDVEYIFDANQGYERGEALRFIRHVRAAACRVRLFEQPLAREDLEGMAWLRTQTDVPLAADESVFTARDALAVIRAGAADIINLKIMKSGVLETLRIAELARGAGLGLMIGGMVETRVAMGCSWSMVLGMGGIDDLDLDTPLLMASDPCAGGYRYHGPELDICGLPGLGMRPVSQPETS